MLLTETQLDNSGRATVLFDPSKFNSVNVSQAGRKGGHGAALFKTHSNKSLYHFYFVYCCILLQGRSQIFIDL